MGNGQQPISYSELQVFSRCRRLWKYAYVDGWKPKFEDVHRWRGKWIHQLLAAYYSGQDWQEVHQQLVHEAISQVLLEEEVEEVTKHADMYRAIMERYIRHYRGEVVRPVIYDGAPIVERELMVEYPFGPLLIRVDLVAQDEDGLIWVWDHKTRIDFDRNMESELDYDLQLSLYILGLRSLGIPVAGGLHNYIRIRLPGVPRVNKDGTLSKAFIITDEETVLETIARTGAKISDEELANYLSKLPKDAFFRRYTTVRTDEELYSILQEVSMWTLDRDVASKNKYYPRALSRSCLRCPFFKPCVTSLKGGDEDVVLHELYVRGEEGKSLSLSIFEEGGDL